MRIRDYIWAAAVATSPAMASLATDPYVYDPAFNGGVVIEDRFAAISLDNRQIAQALVHLDDGSTVVAGIVPAAFQPDGKNVGLVRYGPHGERVPWSAPTPAYSYYNNMYVDYPNSTTANFIFVKDLIALDPVLFALVDQETSGFGDVSLLMFGQDGSVIADVPAFNTGLREYGAGLVYAVVGGHDKLYAVASYVNGLEQYVITIKRFDLSTGMPIADPTFGVSGNGAVDLPFPDNACGEPPCSAIANSVAVVRPFDANPTLYIAGTANDSGTDYNPFVTSVDMSTGLLAAVTYVQYGGLPGTSSFDQGRAIVATTTGDRTSDIVYLVGDLSMPCGKGVTVTRLRGSVDLPGGPFVLPDFGWAYGGTSTFGGRLGAPPCPDGERYSSPFDAALSGDRVAIGVRDTIVGTVTPLRGPVLATVRTSDGLLTAFDDHVALRADGSPWGVSTFDDLHAEPDGSITATGYIIDNQSSGYLFGTTRLRLDRIFGSGFD